MRHLVMLWLVLAVLLSPGLPGCGGPKEDLSHREAPDFVDTTHDPAAIMPDYTPPGMEKQKAAKKP